MRKMKKLKRLKCLSTNELSYLLLVSSVITGCSQEVQRLPNYQEAMDYCKTNPAYCQEADKINQSLIMNTPPSEIQGLGSSGSFGPPSTTAYQGSPSSASSSNNFLNYYLLYHMFFSRGSSVNYTSYQHRFTNYDKDEYEKRSGYYRGFGVYSPGYVNRMHTSIANGKTSFVSSEGKVFKSAQFKGSSKSSITGKTISRGGFGSSGRSYGIGS